MAKRKAKKATAKKKTAKKEDTIKLTQEQFKAAVAEGVATAMAIKEKSKKPLPADITGNVSLKAELETMSQQDLINYGKDKFSLDIEDHVSEKVIIEQLLKLDAGDKQDVRKLVESSTKKTISADDPPIRIKFLNLQDPNEVIHFFFSDPKGMYSKAFIDADGKQCGNPDGHKKCPEYKLVPGETYTLPYSVKEHLDNLTYMTHKMKIDPVTGFSRGSQTILKNKYLLSPFYTKEQLISLQKPQ